MKLFLGPTPSFGVNNSGAMFPVALLSPLFGFLWDKGTEALCYINNTLYLKNLVMMQQFATFAFCNTLHNKSETENMNRDWWKWKKEVFFFFQTSQIHCETVDHFLSPIEKNKENHLSFNLKAVRTKLLEQNCTKHAKQWEWNRKRRLWAFVRRGQEGL